MLSEQKGSMGGPSASAAGSPGDELNGRRPGGEKFHGQRGLRGGARESTWNIGLYKPATW
ncbi:MAG: hypothetical protein KatS3mg111_4165 [Pirellulaceae bacterium]|nr:MAG: hypothetical protein KatS3mg111_4165 [Pirellulaceae bacterium]